MNRTTKNLALLFFTAVIVGSIFYLEKTKPPRLSSTGQDIAIPKQAIEGGVQGATSSTASSTETTTTKQDRTAILRDKTAQYSRAKELVDIAGYINTAPFKLADLVGKKVILVDFLTYSCINCQRTFPYLKSWYEKYKDKGLVIVGVHTPEFDFEKNYNNVVQAMKQVGITYPIVLDNNYGTWNAYGNRFWPHEYLIDIDGFIVHDHIGEGAYDETEKMIQNLLAERARVLGMEISVNSAITAPHQDDIEAGSPETYFGASRNDYLANGTQRTPGEQFFNEPITVELNKLYLVGQWNIHDEYAETSALVGSPQIGSDRIDYRYHSKRVYFVAGAGDKPIDVEVLRDSKPIDPSVRGADIFYKNGKSYVRIQENKLYKIIEDTKSGEHFLEFIISNPGLQAYTFTFG